MTDVQDTPVAPSCLVEKKCTRCGESKSITEFSSHSSQKTGMQSHCKICNQESYKIRYILNHDNELARSRFYRLSNKEKRKAICASYRERNREKISLQAASYRTVNKEKLAIRRSEKKDQNVARAKAWRLANPNKRRCNYHNREARKIGNGGTHTAADISNLLTLQKSKCACCHKSIKSGYHVDHIVPVCRGGTNDRINLQLLCPPCNMTKNAKDPVDFMQSRGFLL